jgi:RNA polymerase sigma-70 factor (ECF subfamily)
MSEYSAAEDASLLTRVAQQDESALSQMYDRYASTIYSWAYRSLGSVEESEEVVLDIFSQVWRIADRYDAKRGSVQTWLFTLARSRIIDRIRRMQILNPGRTVSIEATEVSPKAGNLDLLEEAILRERRSCVLAAMRTISEEQRTILEMAYYQGLSQSQIAAKTGLALGTVKTRTRLGLNKLRSALGTKEDL